MTDPEPVSAAPLIAIPTQDAVLDRIRAYAAARCWLPGRLAVEAGLSRGTLKELFEAGWSPSSATVKACEAVIPAGWQVGDPAPADEGQGASAAAAAGGGA